MTTLRKAVENKLKRGAVAVLMLSPVLLVGVIELFYFDYAVRNPGWRSTANSPTMVVGVKQREK